MATSRLLVTSGSALEPEIGFSRAVRLGPYICVAGTAPIAVDGSTAAPGDVYGQSVRRGHDIAWGTFVQDQRR